MMFNLHLVCILSLPDVLQLLTHAVAPSCAQKQLKLTEREEKGPAHLRGVAAWLADGLKLEEAQYVHQFSIYSFNY